MRKKHASQQAIEDKILAFSAGSVDMAGIVVTEQELDWLIGALEAGEESRERTIWLDGLRRLRRSVFGSSPERGAEY